MKPASLKGLFYREFYLGRKSYLAFGLVTVIMALMFSLILLSFKSGNLALLEDAEETRKDLEQSMMYFITVICSFVSLAGVDTIHLDFNSKWSGFAFASPVKEEVYVGIKYIIMLALNVLGFIIGVLCGIIFCTIQGTEFTFNNLAVIVWIDTVVIVGSVCFMVFAYLFRDMTKAAIAFTALFFAFLVILIIFYLNNSTGKVKLPELMSGVFESLNAYVFLTPVIIIGAFFFGYLISVKLFKRRYN